MKLFFKSTFACIFLFACQSHPEKSVFIDTPQKTVNSIEMLPPVNLAFVGDIILHERLRKREERTREGYQVIWSGIQKYLNKADLSYANLEGPVAPELGGVSGYPRFNFPEKIIPDLKDSGFDVVSNANNHALDRQAKGIQKTIENLKKYKLAHTGTISSEKSLARSKEAWWALTPFHKKWIAWLACTEMTNGLRDKEGQVLFCFKDVEKVKELVEYLKKNQSVAAVIVLPHWGEEGKFEIESYRRRWAHTILNHGATAVVGSHPHVVQKIESYTTEDQRPALISYSLGNFVSNQPWTPNKTSMILYLKLKSNSNGTAYVVDGARYLPLWMSRAIDKDGTSKFRVSAAFDLKKIPTEAEEIWNQQLGKELRFNQESELDLFLNKTMP